MTLAQVVFDGFTWQRNEHSNGISWVRLSNEVAKQDMSYAFYRNTQSWFFHANAKVAGVKVDCPNVERFYLDQVAWKWLSVNVAASYIAMEKHRQEISDSDAKFVARQ